MSETLGGICGSGSDEVQGYLRFTERMFSQIEQITNRAKCTIFHHYPAVIPLEIVAIILHYVSSRHSEYESGEKVLAKVK